MPDEPAAPEVAPPSAKSLPVDNPLGTQKPPSAAVRVALGLPAERPKLKVKKGQNYQKDINKLIEQTKLIE